MRSYLLLAFLLCGLPLASAAEPFDGFLDKHCLRCHGPERVERDLRIDTLSRDFQSGGDGHLWAELVERINSGENRHAVSRFPIRR